MSRLSRYKIFGLALSGVVVASSCTFDSTSPSLHSVQATSTARSSFVPTDAQKAKYVIGKGVSSYSVTINPNEPNTFVLGSNAINIPAQAVCRLDSDYGVKFWNTDCVPETSPINVTVLVRADASGRPRMDFEPAMRFSPDANVELFMFTRHAMKEAKQFKIYYCTTSSFDTCVDESLTDRDLITHVDPSASVVFRRIKHFSGYLVAE